MDEGIAEYRMVPKVAGLCFCMAFCNPFCALDPFNHAALVIFFFVMGQWVVAGASQLNPSESTAFKYSKIRISPVIKY
jgi:hypothetical protein